MANAKKYKREDLLDKAIELFRAQGYSASSTATLVEGLGVNRKSLYAEFGSKQGLFEAALEHYSENHLSHVLAPIEDEAADANTIRKAFGGYAGAVNGTYYGLGCLMANTAVERAALDDGAAQFVDAYLARLQAGFTRALENAKIKGQIAPSVNIADMAAGFAMSVVGISALIRAKAPPDQVLAAGRAITAALS